ncbi:peroxisomal trans-2-enoyl-CoA reductase isoform X3 [Xiphophorus maculatus]|uniref:peroxisomal trans-2-enoyl-CoA reductase isoform X3 n=1 Tax=Xiphophorus maculatus TaxID=8083 RepID=UPI000C6DF03D|nr:peroxisomal trans-2-enoyl-CoA reductase isoform X3 [Xiphophorus maculatus]XP_023191352.1 peroxisomal trans-2-enoyl-CoA reductase isoform X3 [Xiphophorus maculatus]
MDEFQKLDVKIPNSVLVEGISDEDGKEEVFDFLKQYGKITKTEIISEADSEFEGQFVVEFSSGTAVAELRSILPYSFKSSEKSDTFFISELAVVYAEHVSQSKTHSYLFELQKLAKLSGMDFAEVLKSTMTQIGQSVAELHSAAKMEDPDEKSEVMAAAADPTMKEEPTLSTATDPTVSRQRLEQQPTSRQRPSLHDDDIQPPEVQRYVVEHIMKTEESAYHLQRLRVFSGRLPRPAHEADYETWHSGVDLLLKDPSVSELQRSRRIVESLLPPAADMLKHLSSDTPPTVYLNILDSAYGTVQDGEELFAKFMDTFQDAGEKPSSYLQRLQVEGAAGQSVPYLGYVELVITFPEDFIGVNTEVPTLALVVPDTSPDRPSNVLIGMNTLEPLYEQHLSSNHVQFQSMAQGYRAVLKLLQLRHQQNQLGNAGTVRLLSTTPVLISPGQTIVLEGSVKNASPSANKWAIVEHPSSPLPGGLCVQSCLITLPQHPPYKVPVIMKNESEQEVFISPLTIIADIGSAPTVLSQQITSQTSQRTILEFNFGDSPIPPEWKEHIINKMNSMPEVFSHHDMDFGCTDAVKHTIKLNDETPFKHRARPIHPQDLEAVREHLRDLFGAGIIRESKSPFSSPIVVVRKRNGSVRLCIDYRKLNLQTIKDAYALPNLEESFCALTGSKWFTVLDLKSGYYQIEMAEEDKAKTAFVTPLGFWEWNRMPQGITNAPSTFQRLMERCMGDLHLKEVLVFLDDIIIFSATLEEHEERLLRVLSRLKQFGLKLSPEKCKFFQSSVRYLGHIVSDKGVETDPEKIDSLKSWPVPRNLKELRSFLGFAGYYRRFIKDYAAIVKPLNELTRGYPPARSPAKLKKPEGKYSDPKQSFGDKWTSHQQIAFETVISKLTTAPVLGFANPQLPYILHTDASTNGLGAVLYQEQEGKLRVIAYASRGLSVSESKYPAHKLEFLALKWSVTEKFHDYLYGTNFTVVTDSNPLTYVLSSAKLDATGHRWLAALSTYSFQLQYRAGKQNLDADALSRRSHEDISSDQHCRERELIQHLTSQLGNGKNTHDISPEIVDAICQSCIIRTQNQTELSRSVALVESLSVSVNSIPDGFSNEELHGLPLIPSLSQVDLQEQQQADPAIREVIHQLETGEKVLPSVREELSDLPLLLREWNRLELVDGILYRRRHDGDKLIYQLILPPKLRPTVLKSLHHDMGHMGIERTIDLVRQRFFWPKMTLEVETFVRTCGRCIRRKAQIERAAPLINIQTSRPLELLCMDFLTIEPDSSNTKDILVLTDHFTKFAVAIPTPNQKAKTVAKYLWNEFMVYYGIPERIHSDQGTDFESKLIKELCEVVGMKKSRTTPYHPRGNPVERFNRTLLNMLGTLEMKQKSKWREYVKPLVHAYNCTRNVVTGFTPYELMFGRCPRLPVDLAFGLPVREQSSISHSEYVKNLQSSLKESYKLASENALKSAAKNKTRFDQKITPCSLEIGDRVLVRNIRLRGKHKLADRWEPGVYKVVNRAENVPVYTVQPEHKEGPTRTLHRDLLLPCGFLPVCSTEDPSISMPASQRKTRSQDGCHPDVPDAMQEDEDAEPYVPEVSIPSPTRFSVKVRKFESSPESITLQPISPLAQSDAEAPEHPVPLIQSTDLETASPSENEKSCLTTDSSLSHYEDKLPVEQIEAEELSEPHVAEPVKVHMEGEVPDEHLPEVQEPDAEGHLVVQSESSIGPASVSSPYNSIESETLPRRSDRQRQPPSRLTYPVLAG